MRQRPAFPHLPVLSRLAGVWLCGLVAAAGLGLLLVGQPGGRRAAGGGAVGRLALARPSPRTPATDTALALLRRCRRYYFADTSVSRRLARRAWTLALAAHHDSLAVAAQLALGRTFLMQKYFGQARLIYEHAQQQARQRQLPLLAAEATLYLGDVLVMEGHYAAALRNVLAVRSQWRDTRGRSLTEYSLAYYYTAVNNAPLAQQHYIRCARLAEARHDLPLFADANSGLGTLHLNRAEASAGRTYLRRAMATYEQLHLLRPAASCLVELGSSYLDTQDTTRARGYLLAARQAQSRLARAGQPTDPGDQVNTLLLLGDIAQRAGRHKLERRYYEQAARLALVPPIDTFYAIAAASSLADVDQEEGRFPAAETFARRALALAHSQNFVGNKANALEKLAQISAARGRHRRAYALYGQAQAIRDTLITRENSARIAELQARYETERQETRIQQLQRRTRFQREEFQQQRGAFYTVLMALLAAMGAGLLTYYSLRRQRRVSQQLAEREQQVREQNAALSAVQASLRQSLDEKEWLLKEVHHRVKNNLQLISSLLAMQGQHKHRSQEVQQASREIQSWVKSISLSHELLYLNPAEGQGLTQVDFGALARQLAQYLSRAYGGTEAPVRYGVEAEPLLLTARTAVPLGLILNELLTNAYKYAFAPTQASTASIEVCLRSLPALPGTYELRVADNGRGLPAGFSLDRTSSLGLRLVQNLARQLRGSLSCPPVAEGSAFVVSFRPLRGATPDLCPDHVPAGI